MEEAPHEYRRGNGLDEITALAGADLGRTGWTEVTQERVNMFADATGDHQWIHVDAARAAAGPFGGTIAHGYLTLSLVIPLFAVSYLLEVTGISMPGTQLRAEQGPLPGACPGRREDQAGRRGRRGRARRRRRARPMQPATADLTVEVDGGARPACVAQAIYRYYA